MFSSRLLKLNQGSEVFDDIKKKKRRFMTVRMFHKRFVNFVIGAKEKLQNAPRFELDFESNFAICSSNFTGF